METAVTKQANVVPGATVVERPVHSIDKKPETGSKSSHLVAVGVIIILAIFGLILLVLAFQFKKAADFCTNTEAETCYSLTCPSTVAIATCASPKNAPSGGGNYAFRCTSKNTVQCNYNPGVDVPIADGESYLCDKYVASAPATSTTGTGTTGDSGSGTTGSGT